MKRRTLSLSLSLSLCVRMHASARREDLRDFASYFLPFIFFILSMTEYFIIFKCYY